MKALSLRAQPETLHLAAEQMKSINPQVLFVFGAVDKFLNTPAYSDFSRQLENTAIIGCSTSGEIDNKGVSDNGLVIAGAHFDTTQVRSASCDIIPGTNERSAGIEIAQTLQHEGLRCVFVLVPGVGVNGSELVKGMREFLPPSVILCGGLAGDGLNFTSTRTLYQGDVYISRIVAVGLYGNDLVVGTGSRGGWKPFGPARRITKSQKNVLYELDGKPALELYKAYLGDKAEGLPSTGMPYPLAILRDDRSASGLIRSVVNIDYASNSLIMGGEIEENTLVCLMHGNSDLLADGAIAAANEALNNHSPHDSESLNLLISCVGRRAVMGEDTDDEIDAVHDILGPKAILCGFYSYGEICPFTLTGQAELHNHTMTITHIRERTPS